MGLGSKHNQGGISLMAPPTLARQLQSLPPILHRLYPNTMPSCSKAPRGLFVLLRVGRIFTAISISPGPSSRQCSNCYAIRAGRNLPDKEFRSDHLTLFPEKPDFIFLVLYSFRKRFGGSFRSLQGSNAHFFASSSRLF